MSDQTSTPGVLVLPDIAYERRLVRTRINGEAFAEEGWVNGPGCPGRVKAEYSRRLKQFTASFLDSAEAQDAAYHEFRTDALRIIFELPAGRHEQLDLLAGDKARAEQILIFLGWRDADEDASDPEDEGEDGNSTTDRSSPTSVRPTQPPRTAAAG